MNEIFWKNIGFSSMNTIRMKEGNNDIIEPLNLINKYIFIFFYPKIRERVFIFRMIFWVVSMVIHLGRYGKWAVPVHVSLKYLRSNMLSSILRLSVSQRISMATKVCCLSLLFGFSNIEIFSGIVLFCFIYLLFLYCWLWSIVLSEANIFPM